MSLSNELGLKKPLTHRAHEAALAVVYTGELLSKEGTAVLAPYGLTDVQFNVLMLLKHQAPAEGITQSELGGMLLVNRSNVTGIIDRMERAGHVRRTADPVDRRINRVALTDAGRKVLSAAHDAYYKRIAEVMGRLHAPDLAALNRYLDIIRAGLSRD